MTTYTGKDDADQACNVVSSFAKGKDTVIAKLTPDHKGEVTIEFAFANGIADTNDRNYVKDSANVMFTVKDTSNVEEATATVGTIYAVAGTAGADVEASDTCRKAYEQEVKVVAGGAQLGADEYTVSLPTGLVEDTAAAAKDNVRKIYYSGKQNDIKEFKDGTATTVTKTIKITLNGTGETFTQDVTISKEAPYVSSVSLKAGKDTYEVPATTTALDNTNVLDYCIDSVKDQYGVKLDLGDFSSVKFKNDTVVNPIITFQYKTDTAKVEKNGTANATLYPNTGFDAATMLVAFGKNVDEKAVAEINLVKSKDGTESNPALAEFVTAFDDGTGVNKDIVKAINNSAQLNGGTKWGELKNIDKLAIVSDSAFKTAVEANSGTAVNLNNNVVAPYAVSAAAVRTQINENETIKALLSSKIVGGETVDTTVLSTIDKASTKTVTGSALNAAGAAILDPSTTTNSVVIAKRSDVSTGAKIQIVITYSSLTTGISGSFTDCFEIEAVEDIFTGDKTYKVTYVDAAL